jgi:hypothetical protein
MTPEEDNRGGGAPSLLGRATCPILALLARLVRSERSIYLFWWNIDIPEILAQFDFVRVPEIQHQYKNT